MKEEGRKSGGRIAYICFLAASICFYVSAVIGIVCQRENSANWVVQLCLGSTFLCLSTVQLNKEKKGKDE